MFSPDVTSAASARNPRRRVRAAASDESLTAANLRPSTKRRKRSALASDTFEPNGIAVDGGTSAPAVNGHAKLPNGHGSFHKEPSPETARSLRDGEPGSQALVSRSKGSKRGERRGAARELGLTQACLAMSSSRSGMLTLTGGNRPLYYLEGQRSPGIPTKRDRKG
jgi:hypothetical protein